MIDILFRGWSIKHNDWVFGYYVKSRGHHYILQQYNDQGYDERWQTAEWEEVEEDTVSWKTGLKDRLKRDIYGKDIIKYEYDWDYEGDIENNNRVFKARPKDKRKKFHLPHFGVVKFTIDPTGEEGGSGYYALYEGRFNLLDTQCMITEIIGNTKQNPELANEAKF